MSGVRDWLRTRDRRALLFYAALLVAVVIAATVDILHYL